MDNHRFSTVDNQLNVIGQVIGDGRIDGWDLLADSYPFVRVTAGAGIVDRFYVNTFGDQLIELSDNGVFYLFIQRKIGIIGDGGPRSNVVSVSYVDADPPAAPAITLVTLDSFSVTLSWPANTEPDFDCYEVERSTDGINFQLLDATTSNIYTDSLVDESTSYTFRVRAYDLSNNYSQGSLVVTTPESLVGPPDASEVEMYGAEFGINVLWKNPPAVGKHVVDHFLVTCQKLYPNGAIVPGDVQSYATTELYARFDQLAAGDKYSVTVQTVDSKGRLSAGIAKTVMTTLQPGAPPDPINVSYSDEAGSPGGVILNLAWTEGDSPYDPLTTFGYKIYVTVDGQPESLPISVAGGFTSERVSIIPFANLWKIIPENRLVTVRITALATGSTSAAESVGTYVRFFTRKFTAPAKLQAVDSSFDPYTGRITVTWNVRPDTETVHLQVTDKVAGTPDPETVIIDEYLGKADRYVFSSISTGHSYNFILSPCTLTGSCGESSSTRQNILSGDDLDNLPTATLPSLSTSEGDRQIAVKWTSTDPEYVSSYKLYRKQGGISLRSSDWQCIDTIPNTSSEFIDYGLSNGTKYSYYMTGVDIYGRESKHLPDGEYNLNFVSATPKLQTVIREPYSVSVAPYVPGLGIHVTWYGTLEPWDSFVVYRSINNLHSWQSIATVKRALNQGPYSYTDDDMPLVNGTTYYYSIEKILNDAEIKCLTTNDQPSASICIGTVRTGVGIITEIDQSCRRDIKNFEAPIKEMVAAALLLHHHSEIHSYDPDRINLDANLVVNDWTTTDGKIWSTEEDIKGGDVYIVKINGRFPSVFYTINKTEGLIIFAEAIVDVVDGEIVGLTPDLQLWISGVEEVQGTLDESRVGEIHAKQIGYGNIYKEQIPSLSHDGRIKEGLEPDSYLLERYNNNTFVVPESTSDTRKNFGSGTSYFSVYTGDGAIESVVDFEHYDDGAMVAFQKPSFASNTVQNLKQQIFSNTCSPGDVASHITFKDNVWWGLYAGSTSRLYLSDVGDPEKDTLVKTYDHWVIDLAYNPVHDEMLCLYAQAGGANQSIGVMDLATKEITRKYLVDSIGIAYQMEVVTAGSIVVGIYVFTDDANLYRLDYETGAATLIRSTLYGCLAYMSSPVPTMFAAHMDDSILASLDLNTGAETNLYTISSIDAPYDLMVDHASSTSADYLCLYVIGNSGLNTLLVKLERISGIWSETVIRTDLFDTDNIQKCMMPTGFDYYKIDPPSLPIGNYQEFYADAYIRSEITIDEADNVSVATLTMASNTSQGDPILVLSAVDPGVANTVDLPYVDQITAANSVGSEQITPEQWAGEVVLNVFDQVSANRAAERGPYVIFKLHTPTYCPEGAYRVAESSPIIMALNYVRDKAEVNSDPGGFQSSKSYEFQFQFADDQEQRWVRITTENAPIKPNPVINLDKRLRFKVFLTHGSFYMALGIREIAGSGTVGSNGGTVGPIEWVGVQETLNYNNEEIIPRGILITASDEWQEVDFNLRNSKVVSYAGGDGELTAGGRGVLEHLAISINPDDPTSADILTFYIDSIEQVDDLLVAGTSQGIQVSYDLGSYWTPVRLTSTPVHKLFKSSNNLVWAVTCNEVFLSTDPLFWFTTSGLTGVGYIRDIAEDNDGNMYVSTDKGVYWFDIALINKYPVWQQAAPPTAFSTDCYALHHEDDAIWVSTELGIFQTTDRGTTWQDTGLNTAGYVGYEIKEYNGSLFAVNRKHLLRKNPADFDFVIASDLESIDVTHVWSFEFFNGRIYLTASEGVYRSVEADLINGSITFIKTLSDLNFGGKYGMVFCFDVLDMGDKGKLLFAGQENRLSTLSSAGALSTVVEKSGTIPLFYLNDEPLVGGYVYNSFNGTMVFREPQQVSDVVHASYLPISSYRSVNGGWAHTNPFAEFFVYRDGVPHWIYFAFDSTLTLANINALETALKGMAALTDFNSLQPEATALRNSALSTTQRLIALLSPPSSENGTDQLSSTEIRDETSASIILLLDELSQLIASVNSSVIRAAGVSLPGIMFAGQSEPVSGTRSATLSGSGETIFPDCDGIIVNATTGLFDFSSDPDNFVFSKYDHYSLTVFNAIVSNVGQYTHRELEDRMEDRNTGLSSGLASVFYSDLIKTGITLENKHHGLFGRPDISNIQSKYNACYNQVWYDQLNSTIDYDTTLSTAYEPTVRFINDAYVFAADPYGTKIWLASDNGIVQMILDESNLGLELQDVLLPDADYPFIRDLYAVSDNEIYAILWDSTGESKLLRTTDQGDSWTTLSTSGLPSRIYNIHIISGTVVVGTQSGMYYSDDNFLGWYVPDFTTSGTISTDQLNFKKDAFNVDQSVFLIGEANNMFFRSSQGVAYFCPGYISENRTVSKVLRFKNFTYVATDDGLYNDGNTMLSDSVAFAKETLETIRSNNIPINDIVAGADAVYVASSTGKIFRYANHPAYGGFNEWLGYQVPDFSPIHRLVLHESTKHVLFAISYNRVKVIDVTPTGNADETGDGVFKVADL
jgi:hypothetical protein